MSLLWAPSADPEGSKYKSMSDGYREDQTMYPKTISSLN